MIAFRCVGNCCFHSGRHQSIVLVADIHSSMRQKPGFAFLNSSSLSPCLLCILSNTLSQYCMRYRCLVVASGSWDRNSSSRAIRAPLIHVAFPPKCSFHRNLFVDLPSCLIVLCRM